MVDVWMDPSPIPQKDSLDQIHSAPQSEARPNRKRIMIKSIQLLNWNAQSEYAVQYAITIPVTYPTCSMFDINLSRLGSLGKMLLTFGN